MKKFIAVFCLLITSLTTYANSPWISTLGCVPGFDQMNLFSTNFIGKKERMEVITTVSNLARLHGSKHRIGAFGYFNDLNEVVDTGFCEGELGGSGSGFKNVTCKGKLFTMVLGFNHDKCTVTNGIKECVIATEAENHNAELTFFSSSLGFSSNVMTCRKRTYGPNQPIDSIPVF